MKTRSDDRYSIFETDINYDDVDQSGLWSIPGKCMPVKQKPLIKGLKKKIRRNKKITQEIEKSALSV